MHFRPNSRAAFLRARTRSANSHEKKFISRFPSEIRTALRTHARKATAPPGIGRRILFRLSPCSFTTKTDDAKCRKQTQLYTASTRARDALVALKIKFE